MIRVKRKRFKDYDPHQILGLPPSLDEWLPSDHPVYFLSATVDQWDLSAIYDDYTELRGYPPYEPRMMVKVWLYGYMRGIHSSRKLERALHEDVGFRVLSANQQPDHWTLSQFRRRHHKALGDLLTETVECAAKAGLVKLQHVATDGTKVKAYASKHKAMSYGRLKDEDERRRREIEQYLEEVEANDRDEDEEYGDGSGWRVPPEYTEPQKRREVIREAKARVEAEAAERQQREQEQRRQEAEAEGRSYQPRKQEPPTPRDRDQTNFTDPESRIMKSNDGAFIQGYNGQLAVDADTHIILAADLSHQASDTPQLLATLDQIEANTGLRPTELSADAGYYSKANLKELEHRRIEAFIPPNKIRHSDWRQAQPPRGRIPKDATPQDLMRRKLRTKRGRARYLLRQTSVEPVIGHMKEPMGFRQLLLRGRRKARSMWRLQCAAFNLMKLYRHRQDTGKGRLAVAGE